MYKQLRISFFSVLALVCASLTSTLHAEEAIDPQGAARETMLVVVVDSLIQGTRAWNDEEEMYQRIKRNFGKVFEKKQWPVNIEFARWSADVPEDGLQLRIWFKSLEEETFSDLVFRAWVNLREGGEKTADFGIIKVRTYPRPGQNTSTTLDEIVTKAAEEVAKKLDEHKFDKS